MRNDLLFYHSTVNLFELFGYDSYTPGQDLTSDFLQFHWRLKVLPVVAEVIEPSIASNPEHGLVKFGFRTEADAKYFLENYTVIDDSDAIYDAHYYEHDCCF